MCTISNFARYEGWPQLQVLELGASHHYDANPKAGVHPLRMITHTQMSRQYQSRIIKEAFPDCGNLAFHVD